MELFRPMSWEGAISPEIIETGKGGFCCSFWSAGLMQFPMPSPTRSPAPPLTIWPLMVADTSGHPSSSAEVVNQLQKFRRSRVAMANGPPGAESRW